MNAQTAATLLGIVLQLGGAGYLVWQARITAKKLTNFRAHLTYDKFNDAVGTLADELGGQFTQQLWGFAFIAAGSVLQLYGAWPAK